jgi:hypothetical protein
VQLASVRRRGPLSSTVTGPRLPDAAASISSSVASRTSTHLHVQAQRHAGQRVVAVQHHVRGVDLGHDVDRVGGMSGVARLRAGLRRPCRFRAARGTACGPRSTPARACSRRRRARAPGAVAARRRLRGRPGLLRPWPAGRRRRRRTRPGSVSSSMGGSGVAQLPGQADHAGASICMRKMIAHGPGGLRARIRAWT